MYIPSSGDRKCPTTHQPVCGTDDRTYRNQFFLDIVSCKSKGYINRKHVGHCSSRFLLIVISVQHID